MVALNSSHFDHSRAMAARIFFWFCGDSCGKRTSLAAARPVKKIERASE